MGFICVEKCKCSECKHNRFDSERGDKACFLEQDLKAAGKNVYYDYLIKQLEALKKSEK